MLTFADCLRTFLVDRYLKVSYFEDPRCWDIRTAFDYVVAFEGIQTIPVQALDRAQRSDIANRVLCILLQTEPPSLATTTDHLNLLAKIITIPKKSMHILTTTIDTKRKRETPPDPLSALISLACGIDGFIHWSAEQIDSVAALRRLTRSVMRYVDSKPCDLLSYY